MPVGSAADGLAIVEDDENLLIRMGIPETRNYLFMEFHREGNREVFKALKGLKEAIDCAQQKNRRGLPWNLEGSESPRKLDW